MRRNCLFNALCAILLPVCAGAAEMSGKPRAVLDLPPQAGNPRTSEGDFMLLKDGRILFAYGRYWHSYTSVQNSTTVFSSPIAPRGC